MSSTFKPGDRIRAINKLGLTPKGSTGTVGPKGVYRDYELNREYVDVVWDRKDHRCDGGYCLTDFEVLLKPTFAVSLKGSVVLIYSDFESVQEAIDHIAKKNWDGDEYNIYQLVRTIRRRVVTKETWE